MMYRVRKGMTNHRLGMRRSLGCGVIMVVALTCRLFRPHRPDDGAERAMVEDLVRRGRRACEDEATVNGLLPDVEWERYQFVDYFKGVLIGGNDEEEWKRNWEAYETGYPGSLMSFTTYSTTSY